MALFKNYLTCYCTLFILNHAECSFTALKLKKLQAHVVSYCLIKYWKMQCFISLDVG